MLRDLGDPFHFFVQGGQVRDVECGHHIDAGIEQFFHVLPAFLMPRPRHIGVSELVDQNNIRSAGPHRVVVGFVEYRVAVGDLARGNDLKPFADDAQIVHGESGRSRVGAGGTQSSSKTNVGSPPRSGPQHTRASSAARHTMWIVAWP